MKPTSPNLRHSGSCALLFLSCVWIATTGVGAPVTLYSTEFEAAQGFNINNDLGGQNGWLQSGDGGNGLVALYADLGQSAYIGFDPPTSGGLFLWRPVNHTPTNRPIVTVTMDVAVIDSSTADRDEFRWSVYNIAGVRLFSLIFDNRDLNIYHLLDDDVFRFNGWGFENDSVTNEAVYAVRIEMDFAANLWSAWANGTQIVTNELITTTNASRTFGDVDAVWLPGSASGAGDNFMAFDNLSITADVVTPVLTPATLEPPFPAGGGQYVIRVKGAENASYAVEASTNLMNWISLKTNVVSDGYFDYFDMSAAGLPQRFYRARAVP